MCYDVRVRYIGTRSIYDTLEVKLMSRKREERQEREAPLPMLRRPADPIAEAGKRLRDRLSALRPHTDVRR